MLLCTVSLCCCNDLLIVLYPDSQLIAFEIIFDTFRAHSERKSKNTNENENNCECIREEICKIANRCHTIISVAAEFCSYFVLNNSFSILWHESK